MTEAERYMEMALGLAELGRGQTSPNPLVGAVIVQSGEVVGQGAHLKAGGPHAEVHALQMAGERAAGATVYVTLEPCAHHGRTPPCVDALIAAKVGTVVIGTEDSNPQVQGEGVRRLRSAGIEVTTGVLEQEARVQNEAYFTWREKGRPFVVWKCAATLDGYVATQTGDSHYVTSPEARESVHELRRQHPAIAVGVGTVIADNPQLTVRLPGRSKTDVQPLRVVFDSQLRTPAEAAVVGSPGRLRIYGAVPENGADEQLNQRKERLQQQGAEICLVDRDELGRVSLHSALSDLAHSGLTSLLVEAGPRVAGAMLREHLVDQIVYYIAPKLLGTGMSAIDGRQVERMSDALPLTRMSVTQIGPDLRVEGHISQPEVAENGGVPPVHGSN